MEKQSVDNRKSEGSTPSLATKKMRINISDVNDLTSMVLHDRFLKRRNAIVDWLRDHGISVIGKRIKDD